MSKSFLIVGAGIAGTSLAIRLLKAGCQVTVLDKGVNHSTAIAAGMVNPMVFRRMNKSWRLDAFMAEAEVFYEELSALWGVELFHPLIIRRMFSSEQEHDFWLERQRKPEFESYLQPITTEDKQYNLAKNEFGSGRLKRSFWVDANTFYQASLRYLNDIHVHKAGAFEEHLCDPSKAQYDGITYDEIVFCTGFEQNKISYFSQMPIETTKGQVLTVSSSDLPENESLNRKCFVLPLGDNQFKIGATYEWKEENIQITEESKKLLLSNLAVLSDAKVEVLNQVAGIRPTVPDRRPILGRHPIYSKLSIFNGLGTKGYMMAPLLSKEMCLYLLENRALHTEVVIDRYLNLFPKI
jgi:glycine oxidase